MNDFFKYIFPNINECFALYYQKIFISSTNNVSNTPRFTHFILLYFRHLACTDSHKHTYLETARWQFCKLKVKTEKEKKVNKMNSIAFGLKYLKKKKKQNNI